jgi:hypothetical protein
MFSDQRLVLPVPVRAVYPEPNARILARRHVMVAGTERLAPAPYRRLVAFAQRRSVAVRGGLRGRQAAGTQRRSGGTHQSVCLPTAVFGSHPGGTTRHRVGSSAPHATIRVAAPLDELPPRSRQTGSGSRCGGRPPDRTRVPQSRLSGPANLPRNSGTGRGFDGGGGRPRGWGRQLRVAQVAKRSESGAR